jgi:hypothetical protein
MDNVVVELSGEGVSGFDIHARHPAYLAPGIEDRMAADFTGCEFPETRVWHFAPFSTVLYEDERIRLMGHRLSGSWRPDLVDFEVGGRVVHGLHLTQLIVKQDGHDVEVLVLYPADGFWRAKPLPPEGRKDTGFGSSFTIGPLTRDYRSFVRLSRVAFDPATLTYRLDFAEGGSASLKVEEIGRDELDLHVTMDPPTGREPFLLLSSMFVAPDNADVARVKVTGRPGGEPRVIPMDRLTGATGRVFAFGRDLPSRHNTSAPDLTFGPFYGTR